MYDIRADERLMRMFMDGGGIRALAFRSGKFFLLLKYTEASSLILHDSVDGQPILASASATGHIAIWDLNEGGRLLHMVRGAHDSAISAIEWIPGQPVLVSSGEDNSVKVIIFLPRPSIENSWSDVHSI